MSRPEIAVSLADLEGDPHVTLRRLRAEQPVAWIEPLDAWLVTRHDLCLEVMLDPATFTVDDPRFSTQQVIGPSMLSLDGPAHRRHRDPFSSPFRAAEIKELHSYTADLAGSLITDLADDGGGDLRSAVAAPLAVAVMAHILDLGDVEADEVLSWYEQIVDAVHVVTAGGEVPASGRRSFEELKNAVARHRTSSALLAPVGDAGSLSLDEIVSDVAVLLFGGIVTSESATAIAFRYALATSGLIERLRTDPGSIRPFVEETLRLEPSAAAVDRYATRDVTLAGQLIGEGELVRVSLSGANRDPEVFEDPDRLDPTRRNLGKSLTFARGPHSCLGIHLARLETVAAIEALVAHPGLPVGDHLDPVRGLVFRVPRSVMVTWRGPGGPVG